jgi:multidrug resistance efflux pump
MTFTSTISRVPELVSDDNEFGKALIRIAELRARLSDAQTRKRALGGGSVGGSGIAKAEDEDRKAAAAALASGTKPPKPKAPALGAEYDGLRKEIPTLEAAVRTAVAGVRQLIDRRADLAERAQVELDQAAAEVASAAESLDAGLARLAEAQYTIKWLRRFPKQAPAAATNLRVPSDGGPRGYMTRDELADVLKAHVGAASA